MMDHRPNYSATETEALRLTGPVSVVAIGIRLFVPSADTVWIAWSASARGVRSAHATVDGESFGTRASGWLDEPDRWAGFHHPWAPMQVPAGHRDIALCFVPCTADAEVRDRSLHIVVGGERPWWEPGDILGGHFKRNPYRFSFVVGDEFVLPPDPFAEAREVTGIVGRDTASITDPP